MRYKRRRNCLRGESKHPELFYQILIFIRRIVDNHYEHALRLFYEQDTGVVRLQASVVSGDLENKPIWTAFIPQTMKYPIWFWPDNTRVVHLADLQQYIFSKDYNPPKTSSGNLELTFIRAEGKVLILVRLIVYANSIRCYRIRNGP